MLRSNKNKLIRALGLCLLIAQAVSAQHWTGTWATAVEKTGDKDMPHQTVLANNSLREIVHVSLGGEVLRLELSNYFGNGDVEIKSVYIADAEEGPAINAKTAKYLKFNGKQSVTIAEGKSVFSDALKYHLQPLQRLSVTINYGVAPKNATSHRGSRTRSYIMEGESKPNKEFQVAEVVEHWYNIAAIDVDVQGKECVACLGNSITDGRGTTTDAQNRWTDVCAEALHGEVGVLNLGIGGNCVVQGGIGLPAVERFDHDIMAQRGLTAVIIYEGINDIGGSKRAETTARLLISAYETFIEKAHKAGLKAYGATITQIANTGHWSYFHEAVRQTVNEWIRTSGKFDAVIDFDRLMQDPDNPIQMNPAYQYDRLHPNAEGYKRMGEEAAAVLRANLPVYSAQ